LGHEQEDLVMTLKQLSLGFAGLIAAAAFALAPGQAEARAYRRPTTPPGRALGHYKSHHMVRAPVRRVVYRPVYVEPCWYEPVYYPHLGMFIDSAGHFQIGVQW
jgi:hypothetical protein